MDDFDIEHFDLGSTNKIDWKDFEEEVNADYDMGEDGPEIDTLTITLCYHGYPNLRVGVFDYDYYLRNQEEFEDTEEEEFEDTEEEESEDTEEEESEDSEEIWSIGATVTYESNRGEREQVRLQLISSTDFVDRADFDFYVEARAIIQEMSRWYLAQLSEKNI